MFRIDADGTPVGGIGYWKVDHDGVPAWETGWSVEPAWQGLGIAPDSSTAGRRPRRGAAATSPSPSRTTTPWSGRTIECGSS